MEDRPFTQRRDYRHWRERADSAVADAQAILAEEKEYTLHFDDNPGLGETLKTLSAPIERPLREERAE